MEPKDVKEVALLLMAHGAPIEDENQQGIPLLSILVKSDCFTREVCGVLLQKFIEAGANVHIKDNEGNSLLHYAGMYSSKRNLIRLLVEQGLDVNAKNTKGETPLLLAISKEKRCEVYRPAQIINTILTFLELGADPEVRDREGRNFRDKVQMFFDSDYCYSFRERAKVATAVNNLGFKIEGRRDRCSRK